jgi:N6-L-threonylcarbamoyladenine synthase
MASPPAERIVLGIETSCDETGVGLYSTSRGLIRHALHSQVALHARYGGVVPELASRDHIKRLLPLVRRLLAEADLALADIHAIAYTKGPGLAGALLVGAAFAESLAYALSIPAIGLHHLEAHLLSPLMVEPPPRFPFLALLVSGGHSQIMRVGGLGDYQLLGETHDDAAGEAFDKTAKLLGLPYPGGPALAKLAESGRPGRFRLTRPMIASGDLHMSFSGLKTAVLTEFRARDFDPQDKADLATEFQAAVVDVLVAKCMAATRVTDVRELVVAGGVGANRELRAQLSRQASEHGVRVYYPPIEFCTDNGAMVAFAGALRVAADQPNRVRPAQGFSVNPRWDLDDIEPRASEIAR